VNVDSAFVKLPASRPPRRTASGRNC